MSHECEPEDADAEVCSENAASKIYVADAFRIRKRGQADRRRNLRQPGKRQPKPQQTLPLVPIQTDLSGPPSHLGADGRHAWRGRHVIIADDGAIADQSGRETVIWTDNAGPLVISRIDGARGQRHRLRLGDEVAVDVFPGQVIAASPSRVPRATVDHFLADQVLPRVRADDGEFVLHAGGVRIGNGAVLVLGPSGAGKSTLVTSFDQAGFALLGDDAMVVSPHPDGPQAGAVYPSLRLFPDSIAALLPPAVVTDAVAHYSDKQRVFVPLNRSTDSSLAIRAAFIIGDSPADGSIASKRLTIGQACMAFLANSFALDPSDVDRARDRLQQASILADAVPAFEIGYPRAFDRLPLVRAAMLELVDRLEAGANDEERSAD